MRHAQNLPSMPRCLSAECRRSERTQFDDDWTPAHLASGETNLYKEIAIALKGSEWRQPGLVAFARKLATSVGAHKPIRFEVPASYEPKKGPNVWAVAGSGEGDGGEGEGGEGEGGEGGGGEGDGGEGVVPPAAALVEPAPEGEAGNAAASSSEAHASAGASAAMVAPPPRPQTEVELDSTSTAVPTSAPQGSNVRVSAVVGRARGNSLAEDSSVDWLAVRSSGQADDRAGQPAATAHAPAAEPPADPATRSPMAALPEPIAALTKRFSRMLSSDQTGEGEQGGSPGNLVA
jgi:hypothetical protein